MSTRPTFYVDRCVGKAAAGAAAGNTLPGRRAADRAARQAGEPLLLAAFLDRGVEPAAARRLLQAGAVGGAVADVRPRQAADRRAAARRARGVRVAIAERAGPFESPGVEVHVQPRAEPSRRAHAVQ